MERRQLAKLCEKWGHPAADNADRGDCIIFLLMLREKTAPSKGTWESPDNPQQRAQSEDSTPLPDRDKVAPVPVPTGAATLPALPASLRAVGYSGQTSQTSVSVPIPDLPQPSSSGAGNSTSARQHGSVDRSPQQPPSPKVEYSPAPTVPGGAPSPQIRDSDDDFDANGAPRRASDAALLPPPYPAQPPGRAWRAADDEQPPANPLCVPAAPAPRRSPPRSKPADMSPEQQPYCMESSRSEATSGRHVQFGRVDSMSTRTTAQAPTVSMHCHTCGNVFMADALFCRKCGAPRAGLEDHEWVDDNDGELLPFESEAGFKVGGSALHLAKTVFPRFKKKRDEDYCVLDLTKDDIIQLEETFHVMDMDGTGSLDFMELQELWRSVFPSLSHHEVDKITSFIFEDIDVDGDQEVSWQELKLYMTGTYDGTETQEIAKLVGLPSFVHHDRPDTWRHWLWAIMDPQTSEQYRTIWLKQLSLCIACGSQVVILLSTVNLLMESLPDKSEHLKNSLKSIETFCASIFTAEFVLRFVACPCQNEIGDEATLISQRTYWLQPFTWIDLISVVPFFLELFQVIPSDSRGRTAYALRLIRLARLTRILRMFKLGRHSQGIQLLMIAVSRARLAIVWMCMLIVMAVVLFASFMFFAEVKDAELDEGRGRWVRSESSGYADRGKDIQFQSIFDAMWWALGTLTGCSYGDQVPVTDDGRAVASVCMVTGLLVTAYPITILSINFSDVWDQYKDGLARKYRRKRLLQAASTDDKRAEQNEADMQKNLQRLKRKAEELRVEKGKADESIARESSSFVIHDQSAGDLRLDIGCSGDEVADANVRSDGQEDDRALVPRRASDESGLPQRAVTECLTQHQSNVRRGVSPPDAALAASRRRSGGLTPPLSPHVELGRSASFSGPAAQLPKSPSGRGAAIGRSQSGRDQKSGERRSSEPQPGRGSNKPAQCADPDARPPKRAMTSRSLQRGTSNTRSPTTAAKPAP